MNSEEYTSTRTRIMTSRLLAGLVSTAVLVGSLTTLGIPNEVTWTVDKESDWKASGSNAKGLGFASGEAKPTGNTAEYSSTMKTFDTVVKANKVTFKQSPAWNNWKALPERLDKRMKGKKGGDAPVFLPVADGDYYYFDRHGKTDGKFYYEAWHSKDMVNWTQGGPVTQPNHRWGTTAEYKDGKFYIYVDSPNDHTPHVYVDDNVMDNKVATPQLAFDDPTHGGDIAVLRNDEDGLFHMVYEDRSANNAREQHWDGTLGGHTYSEDGLHFEYIPNNYAVDERTTSTGETATFGHPKEPIRYICEYEVHEPMPDAFGDYTMIKVGSEFYMFGDYSHGYKEGEKKFINTAIMHTSDINETFDVIGEFSNGHPDPTVGFAEGKFWFITQSSEDYTSSGPWDEKVEARAGVDTDGNGSVDQWTPWQQIKESYKKKPGYARVVVTTPAALDLSGLPQGKGFKFEFKVTGQSGNAPVPIMDRVDMEFATSALPVANRKSLYPTLAVEGQLIRYRVNQPGTVQFSLYNLEGALLQETKRQHPASGNFTLVWEGLSEKWSLLKYTDSEGGSHTTTLNPTQKQ